MAVIFAMLLLAYACLRCGAWVRGQMRWQALKHQAPRPRGDRQLEEGATDDLVELNARLNELRALLAANEHIVFRASVTDPDAFMGEVRSSRYRVAVRRTAWALDHWLYELAAGDETDARLHCETEALDRITVAAKWLSSEAALIARTRALESFELARVERTVEVMASCRAAMWDWQAALDREAHGPYRRAALDLQPELHAAV